MHNAHAIHPSGHNIQHAPERVELTEAETVPAKALRSTAAADARVASFMVDGRVWSCLLCSENKIMIRKSSKTEVSASMKSFALRRTYEFRR